MDDDSRDDPHRDQVRAWCRDQVRGWLTILIGILSMLLLGALIIRYDLHR